MRLLVRKLAVSLLMVLALEVFLMKSVSFGQASHRDADALSQASVIYIATVRKDGNQSKAAPVWFTTPIGRPNPDSNGYHNMEGKTDSAWQPCYRLDR